MRLARHFIRRQDIEAAFQVASRVLEQQWQPEPAAAQAEEMAEIGDWLRARYAHTTDPATLAAYYAERVGPTNDHVFQGLLQAPPPASTSMPSSAST